MLNGDYAIPENVHTHPKEGHWRLHREEEGQQVFEPVPLIKGPLPKPLLVHPTNHVWQA